MKSLTEHLWFETPNWRDYLNITFLSIASPDQARYFGFNRFISSFSSVLLDSVLRIRWSWHLYDVPMTDNRYPSKDQDTEPRSFGPRVGACWLLPRTSLC